jgi:hypothetical protein
MEARLADSRRCLSGEPLVARTLIGAAIEGRLTFTPRIDDAGEAYEITGVANVAALIGSNTLDEMASPMPASWNQITLWLRQIDALREAA